MSSVVYAIVFQGKVLEGFQPISVKAHMAKLLKADAGKMAALFSGKAVVLKRTPKKEEAIKYATVLKKVGADITVKGVKTAAAAPTAATNTALRTTPAPSTATPPAATAGSLSLAPNVGNIVEPAPPVPAPDIDLSGISIAENDNSPLAPPKPVTEVHLDLSEFSVAENDGSPLVEPDSRPAPKVDVPDFGLDVPGAVLETLKEEVEEVHPDISGITMAMPGIDLLDESEKDHGPPPPAPDVSKIHLVPNFDVG